MTREAFAAMLGAFLVGFLVAFGFWRWADREKGWDEAPGGCVLLERTYAGDVVTTRHRCENNQGWTP